MATPNEPTRAEGERMRLRHAIDRLEHHVRNVRRTLADTENGVEPGGEAGAVLMQVSGEIAVLFGKLDAYMRADDDAKKPPTGDRP